jgi:hypothetical protein
MMKRSILLLPVLLSAAVAPLHAAPYWVAYEGDVFPEDDGWRRRNLGDGPADRSLSNGVLTIDSLWSDWISDFYQIDRQIDPEPRELFVAEWRVRIVESYGVIGDVGVSIAPDTPASLGFRYEVDSVTSAREGWSLPIAPNAFHAYRIESMDMLNYAFFVDDVFVRNGVWDTISTNQSFVNWGDAVRGSRSLSEWDYFRFGVVPEPGTLSCFLFALFLTKRRSSNEIARSCDNHNFPDRDRLCTGRSRHRAME